MGIIYADNIKAGKFRGGHPHLQISISSQLRHNRLQSKDKSRIRKVINVQDEVKSEAQVNVAAEDTQKADAAERRSKADRYSRSG